jgi:hypothetical protein
MRLFLATTNEQDFGFLQTSQASLSEENAVYLPHVLLSYHYFRNYDFARRLDEQYPTARPVLFCDSGGFSAKTLGVDITVKEYGAWLLKNHEYFHVYATLDVIGDPAATNANQIALEDMGLKPIPVFHVGTPWGILEDLIENHPYIALGGLVPHKANHAAIHAYLVRCFEMAKGAGVKFHGFGLTRWETMKSFPFYSVDSSSWNKGVMFGRFSVFDRKKGGFDEFQVGNELEVLKRAKQIRDMGFDPKDFIDKSRYKRPMGCRFMGVSWAQAAIWLQKYWRNRHPIYFKRGEDVI